VSPATLLGVDVGTTGVRAAVFDEHGHVLAAAVEPCPHEAAAQGYAEADPEAWWSALGRACRRAGQVAPLDRVDAVGVTGQAPTAVLVDGDGRALRRAILWLDVRADVEARAIDRALGKGRAEAIGGNRMHAYYLGPKLAWVRAHEPPVLDRTAFVLQSHAFLVARLTGENVCDESTAMLCAPLFDARSREWSEEGARAACVPRRILPRIVRAEQVVGVVTDAAAEATGLRAGTPVVGGGGDFAASALGMGVVEEGEACLMLGTSGNLLMPMRRPTFDSRLVNARHVGVDRWLSLGGTLCGAALEWFRRTHAPGEAWETLDREGSAVDVRELGQLVALPYFQGERTPIWDEHARGAFFGIELVHGRGHMYRALLEGVALGFRHSLVVAAEARGGGDGAGFERVVMGNGAGKSALFRQILADALGVPVAWAAAGADGDVGATVAGAALLAGIGVGAVTAVGERAKAWQGPRIVHQPEARAHERLREVFVRRLALYEAVREVMSPGHSFSFTGREVAS
jgi:xylulokinase